MPVTQSRLESDLKFYTLSPVQSNGFNTEKLTQGADHIHLDINSEDTDYSSDEANFGVELSRSQIPKFTIKERQEVLPQPEITRIPRLFSRYLQPNAKFVGEQQLSLAKYHIQVEIKTINLLDSVVSGYLTISGLTITHPEMTTSFKAEIINNPLHNTLTHLNKTYLFITQNPTWGSSVKNDLVHWSKLTGCCDMNESQFYNKLSRIQSGNEDHGLLYMRWKEEFLVPDLRIKRINGASFEGFYYVVLNIGGYNREVQGRTIPPGAISGLYYHKSSERFQSLTLKYTEERRGTGVFEFQ